jgi:hypothetical protein
MKAIGERVDPEDYILAALPPEERLDAAFTVASEVFKKTRLTVKGIDNAVKSIRRKTCEKVGGR